MTLGVCKFVFNVLNSIFIITGIVFCAIATLLLAEPDFVKVYLHKLPLKDEFINKIQIYSKPISYAFTGVGAAVFLISFCGCAGSCFDSSTSLNVYLIAVILIFLIALLTIILLSIYRVPIRENAYKELRKQIEQKYTGDYNTSIATLLIDFIQMYLNCCGIYSFEEFENAQKWNESRTFTPDNENFYNFTYPLSCCSTVKRKSFDFSVENFRNLEACINDSIEIEYDLDANDPEKTSTNKLFECREKITPYFVNSFNMSYVALATIIFLCFLGSAHALFIAREISRVN